MVSMQGYSITSAPSSFNLSLKVPIECLGRVTITLCPNKSLFINQSKESDKEQTSPTAIIAGECIFSFAASSTNVEMVATILR